MRYSIRSRSRNGVRDRAGDHGEGRRRWLADLRGRHLLRRAHVSGRERRSGGATVCERCTASRTIRRLPRGCVAGDTSSDLPRPSVTPIPNSLPTLESLDEATNYAEWIVEPVRGPTRSEHPRGRGGSWRRDRVAQQARQRDCVRTIGARRCALPRSLRRPPEREGRPGRRQAGSTRCDLRLDRPDQRARAHL